VGYGLSWYLTFSLFLAVSVFIAGISYYIIEAPFLKFSSKIGREIRQPAISS
jgi:peptidoglycan/LPS O-acetylase OafA/YrhL